MENDRVGIPPELMRRDKGERIPFYYWGDGLMVFNKPQFLASREDPWHATNPDLERCFNIQVSKIKPELVHHRIDSVAVCNPLEPEVTGAVLAAVHEASVAHWRNAFGSFQFTFHYLLVTRKSLIEGPLDCHLPLMRHYKEQRMRVSHKLGKKSHTRFSLVARGRDADAWLCSSRYPRLHQIRVHSRESGIPPLRDPKYDTDYPKTQLGEDLHKLDWCHSCAISAEPELKTQPPVATVDFPKYWKRNLRKVGLELEELSEVMLKIVKNMALPID